jgi:hypothetical protein
MQKIHSILNYTFVNSLEKIEETSKDLSVFVQFATIFQSNDRLYTDNNRIKPIQDLYISENSPPYSSDYFRWMIVNQAKRVLQELSYLSTEEKQKYVLREALSHTDLINCLEYLYPDRPKHEGICHGFAFLGLQAIFTRTIDRFDARLKKLALLLNDPANTLNVPKMIEKIRQQNDFDLLAFFEGLELCSRGEKYRYLFNEETYPHFQLNDKFIHTVLPMVASKELEEVAIVRGKESVKSMIEIAQTSGAYSKKQLYAYFESLQNKIHSTCLPNEPFALLMGSFGHTCLVGYDPSEKTWICIDANTPFSQKTVDVNKIVLCVFKELNPTNYRHIFFHASVLCTKTNSDVWAFTCSLWKISCSFREIDRINRKAPLKNNGKLLIAARYNDLSSINKLIKKNISVNRGLPWIPYTPLSIATEAGHIDMMKILLASGATVDQETPPGKTPLLIATEMENVDAMKTLLAFKADVNKENLSGKTPLFIAAANGNKECVELLLYYGADPGNFTKDGATPLFIAEKNGHSEIVQILGKYFKKKRSHI